MIETIFVDEGGGSNFPTGDNHTYRSTIHVNSTISIVLSMFCVCCICNGLSVISLGLGIGALMVNHFTSHFSTSWYFPVSSEFRFGFSFKYVSANDSKQLEFYNLNFSQKVNLFQLKFNCDSKKCQCGL